jgi:hypothetical protein
MNEAFSGSWDWRLVTRASIWVLDGRYGRRIRCIGKDGMDMQMYCRSTVVVGRRGKGKVEGLKDGNMSLPVTTGNMAMEVAALAWGCVIISPSFAALCRCPERRLIL